MKVYAINRLQKSLSERRMRWFPDDWFMPVDDIRRPPDMEKRVFKRRIESIRATEKKIDALIWEGVSKWRERNWD